MQTRKAEKTSEKGEQEGGRYGRDRHEEGAMEKEEMVRERERRWEKRGDGKGARAKDAKGCLPMPKVE